MAHSTTRWLLGALAIAALALAVPAVTAHDGASTPYGNNTTAHNATVADAPPANATAAEWETWLEARMVQHMGPGAPEWMEAHMGVPVGTMGQLLADSGHVYGPAHGVTNHGPGHGHAHGNTAHGPGHGHAHGNTAHGPGHGHAHGNTTHGAGYGPAQGAEYGPHAGGPAVDRDRSTPATGNTSTQGYPGNGYTGGYGHGCH